MKERDLEKEQIIDAIARKMKFLGTYRYFNHDELIQKSIEELKKDDYFMGLSVNVYSNPLVKKGLKAITKGKMDPQWEPFVYHLTTLARSRATFGDRRICKALVEHVKTSNILLNYTCLMLTLSYENNNSTPDIELFYKPLWSLFTQTKFEYLLVRVPMAYTFWEGFALKALLQVCRDPGEDFDVQGTSETLNMFVKSESERNEAPKEIKAPRLARKIFGSKERFRQLSLYEYGIHFFKIMHNQK